MKIFVSASTLFFYIIFLSACKGDIGPEGPAGPAGANGATGATGPTGATGSANVTQYNFPGFTHSGTEINRDFNVTAGNLEKSMVLAYVKTILGNWYPIPGSITSTFEYRAYYGNPNTTTSRFHMTRLTGSGDQAFTALRIVVIPAATVVNGRYSSIDYKNYLQVAQTFSLPVH